MAEEKKYTFWNGNDWATNHIWSEDKLRLADLSNDAQILTDFITGNPDGEKQRAAKNFEHMMGISGYTPKEVVKAASKTEDKVAVKEEKPKTTKKASTTKTTTTKKTTTKTTTKKSTAKEEKK